MPLHLAFLFKLFIFIIVFNLHSKNTLKRLVLVENSFSILSYQKKLTLNYWCLCRQMMKFFYDVCLFAGKDYRLNGLIQLTIFLQI